MHNELKNIISRIWENAGTDFIRTIIDSIRTGKAAGRATKKAELFSKEDEKQYLIHLSNENGYWISFIDEKFYSRRVRAKGVPS